MKSFLKQKVLIAFGLAILALLFIGTTSYRWMTVSDESTRWVWHTHEILLNIQDLLLSMERIDSSSREFASTGNESVLEPYHASVQRVAEDREAIRSLTLDNGIQQRQLPAVAKLAAEKIQHADRVIDLRRTQGLAAATAALGSESDKQIKDEFQAAVDNLQSEELRLQAQRSAKTEWYSNQSKIFLILGTLFAILVISATGWTTVRDISNRKAAEARYRGLLEAAPDGMVVVDQSGAIVLLNVQAEKHFGYRSDELLGQKVTNIIPEGFAERLIADGTRTAAEALAQQIGTGIELYGRRKDGSEFPIEIMLSPLESAEGILVTAAIRDITTRKDAERHLAQMEARYRGLLEAAPDGMVVVDQSGAIVLLNVQAEKHFGYRSDELLGQKVTNIIPEGFAERLIADGTRTTAEALAQQIGTGIELYGRRKDGSEFPIEIMLSPLESTEGILVTAAIRDITVRREAEANLAQKVEELNRSNEELEQFAYIASHDLQEPLRMVASYTQLLSKRYKGRLDSDADEFIAFAVDGASRMQRLIQDLLAYSRVGKKGSELLDVSSEESLLLAINNLRSAIEDSGALVTHDPLPRVMADEVQLTQLLQNLVGNAIKYQRPGVPLIHVSAVRNDKGMWLFSIRDNGLGIDSQFFEKIFGMFQRLHKREEFAGTGMGLAICKKIVERHGGEISVESQPGVGSTFHFTLAASKAQS